MAASSGPSCVGVLGATGQQGGAVLRALVAKGVSVVAITRNPSSEKAKVLAGLSKVEVRQADLDDQKSLEAAFNGCDGAFVVANFWEGMDPNKEMKQYENCANALKAVGGMKHIVMSSLEDTATHPKMADAKVLLNHPTGNMKVPHFDAKNRSHAFFKGLPVTFLYTSCFVENFTSFFSLNKQGDGSYQFTLPLGEGPIAWTILEDVGKMTAGILERPEMIGQTVGQDPWQRFIALRCIAALLSLRRSCRRRRTRRSRTSVCLGTLSLRLAFPAPRSWRRCSSFSRTMRMSFWPSAS
uniref:NmrA-like domain-containing protein n=1 Tax=Oxyrrhis marina TaxID=2969 RepID=A0A7S4GNB7_OXYMA